MTSFCTDRDLLATEPLIYLSGGFPAQAPAAGDDGELDGTSFTSAGSDFAAAGAAPGMVLRVADGPQAQRRALEVVSVEGPTALTVSVLRPDAEADAVPPVAGTGLHFELRTFAAQIASVSATLAEKLRTASEAAGISAAEFADSAQLARCCAAGVLASVYTARAENAAAEDANWTKAEHYRRVFRRRQVRLRLAVDADSDGTAESTRTLGHVALRRV